MVFGYGTSGAIIMSKLDKGQRRTSWYYSIGFITTPRVNTNMRYILVQNLEVIKPLYDIIFSRNVISK